MRRRPWLAAGPAFGTGAGRSDFLAVHQRVQRVTSRLSLRACGSGTHGPRSLLPARGRPRCSRRRCARGQAGRCGLAGGSATSGAGRERARSVPSGCGGALQHAPRDRGGSGTSPRAPARRVVSADAPGVHVRLPGAGAIPGADRGRRWGRERCMSWGAEHAVVDLVHAGPGPLLLPFVEPTRSAPPSCGLAACRPCRSGAWGADVAPLPC